MAKATRSEGRGERVHTCLKSLQVIKGLNYFGGSECDCVSVAPTEIFVRGGQAGPLKI